MRLHVKVATAGRVVVLLLLLCAPSPRAATAGAALSGEPYGRFAMFSPTGHAAVYLSRVCAETPTQLRRCNPDELGVVIVLNRVGNLDWVAIPLVPYLYAVERSEQVLLTPAQRWSHGSVTRTTEPYRR